MTLRRIAGVALLIFIAYILIAGAVLLFMPFTASAATPLDTACMARLKATTTYEQRKARCLVQSGNFQAVAPSATHRTVAFWIGHEMIIVKAIFEIDKKPSPYPWSSRKWFISDKQCWVERSILYTTEITTCAGRRAGDRLHMDMTIKASFLAFKWPLDIGITKSVHSWKTIRDQDDYLGPTHMEG